MNNLKSWVLYKLVHFLPILYYPSKGLLTILDDSDKEIIFYLIKFSLYLIFISCNSKNKSKLNPFCVATLLNLLRAPHLSISHY